MGMACAIAHPSSQCCKHKEIMEIQDIQQKLLNSIEVLCSKNHFLIENDISERAISHKLAIYIECEFSEFDVDCEYNGYVESDKNKKYIKILKDKANKLGIKRNTDGDNEIIYREVYPDIIIHKRGRNTEGSNLLIIEMKKSYRPDNGRYDREKLCSYTSRDDENNLNYKLGAFILLNKRQNPCYTIEWYKDGTKMKE